MKKVDPEPVEGAPQIEENFFRHQYGHLVATLSRRVGVHNLEIVEDAVQSALMTALTQWPAAGLPDNPAAWLFRVAHNNLMDAFRTHSGHQRLLAQNAELVVTAKAKPEVETYLAGEVGDDLLRMLFVCCDDSLPTESQLALALKTLCGFGVKEIAQRLFTSEANIYKRLTRARHRLQELHDKTSNLTQAPLSADVFSARLPAVHKILYLLFTEGYLSSHAEQAIRLELCQEAIRLALLLAENPLGQDPSTAALLALMHLHSARMTSRQDGAGGLLLLHEQDRTLWNQEAIEVGLYWLGNSASGDIYSRYHAEAAIAAEHCLATSFDDTRWEKVAEAYALLERVAPSAIHRLNRAVAVAQWRGPQAGLEVLKGFEPPTWLAGSYMWAAVLSDLHRRNGETEIAHRYRTSALALAPTPAVQDLLSRRLQTKSVDT